MVLVKFVIGKVEPSTFTQFFVKNNLTNPKIVFKNDTLAGKR